MGHVTSILRIVISLLAVTALGLAGAIVPSARPSAAAGFGAYTANVSPADVFPGADGFGPFEGQPRAAAAYRNGKIAGYVFETADIGYSGKPIRILAGLDSSGTFTGARVLEHHEPILLVGIPPQKLFDFVGRYAGRSLLDLSKSGPSKQVDVISGATVTAVVISDGLTRSALAVAKSRGIAGFAPPMAGGSSASATKALATVPYSAESWGTLLAEGSIKRLHLLNREVDVAFQKIGVGSPEPYAKAGVPDEDFIDLYTGLFNVETIGRSLLEEGDYRSLSATIAPGQSVLIIASNGDYSFRGSGFVRGGIFDRIQLVQGDQTILFRDKDHRRIDHLKAPNPVFNEIGLFRVPQGTAFDPTRPFRIDLLAQRPTGPIQKAYTSFSLDYELPERFIATVAAPATSQVTAGQALESTNLPADPAGGAPPLWLKIWQSHALDVAVVIVSLLMLTAIFFFQDWLVRRPVLFARLRTGFLVFSLLWLGLYERAQLSIVNVLTFANAVISGFRWETFLLEPLIFILWCAVAASLLFWGRGAYCGWLCPFGALQELLSQGAKRLGIRQLTVPFYVHERAWALKYLLFLGLFGVSLSDMALAEQLSEVEPFKTVVLLHFAREWWFVLFALVLLAAGLFIERFYCRYLCVLGASLAVPGRGRMFDWLKRRKQCGFECQLCAKECMVQAIHPLGQINPHECLYCMHCQVVYWDDHKCPPLIMKRERRGKKGAENKTTIISRAHPPDTSPESGSAHKEKEKVHV